MYKKELISLKFKELHNKKKKQYFFRKGEKKSMCNLLKKK